MTGRIQEHFVSLTERERLPTLGELFQQLEHLVTGGGIDELFTSGAPTLQSYLERRRDRPQSRKRSAVKDVLAFVEGMEIRFRPGDERSPKALDSGKAVAFFREARQTAPARAAQRKRKGKEVILRRHRPTKDDRCIKETNDIYLPLPNGVLVQLAVDAPRIELPDTPVLGEGTVFQETSDKLSTSSSHLLPVTQTCAR